MKISPDGTKLAVCHDYIGVELFDSEWNKIKEYVNKKEGYHIKNLLTPSASARFQIKEYKINNPKDKTPLRNFILEEWKKNWRF